MKQLFKSFRLVFAAIVASAAVVTAHADSQGYPSLITTCTNIPQSMTNGQVSAYTNNYIPLRNTGLAVEDVFTGSNLVTAPVTLYFYPSVDGTNAFSSSWASLNIASSGTNLVVGGTNWSRYTLQGFAGMFIAVSNGSGNVILENTNVEVGVVGNTNVTYSTNVAGGLIINRPNQ